MLPAQYQSALTPLYYRFHYSTMPPESRLKQSFLRFKGNRIGHIALYHEPWMMNPDQLTLDTAFCQPATHAGFILKLIADIKLQAKKSGKSLLRTSYMSNQKELQSVLAQAGFKEVLTEYCSECDLTTCKPENFTDAHKNLEQAGWKIQTLRQLKTEYPDWQQRYFDLTLAIEQDVPTDTHINVDQRYWQLQKYGLNHDPSLIYIAHNSEVWAGLSDYKPFGGKHGEPEGVFTELTGVLTNYRRRKLCLALKAAAMTDLKKCGFKRILTGNEMHNPMYTINLNMGFVPFAEERTCHLIL